MSRTLYDPIEPRRLGSLDPMLKSRVNGEIYRFASMANRLKFERETLRWCGIVRDPVSGCCFIPDRTAKRLDYSDGPYYFTCDSTRLEFSRNPERFAIHRDY